jgi:uracil-DNA glycosylase family 4
MRCVDCTLNKSTKVYGNVGKKDGLLLLGEAPGETEVQMMEVFSGKAGGILRRNLTKREISIPDTTIINVLLCRPPGNRSPTPIEIKSCRPRVLSTITVMRPRLIALLGVVPFRCIYKRNPAYGERFKKMKWHGIRTLLIYHPSYFNYNHDKQKEKENFGALKFAWEEEKWRP